MLPNRWPNLSHYDQRVPANLFEPFRAVRDEDKCVACLLRYRINCFTARLLSVVGVEDLCGLLLDGELYVWSPRCHEDEFSDGCAKVGVIGGVADASSITVEASTRIDCRFPSFVTCADSKRDCTRSVLFITSKTLLPSNKLSNLKKNKDNSKKMEN